MLSRPRETAPQVSSASPQGRHVGKQIMSAHTLVGIFDCADYCNVVAEVTVESDKSCFHECCREQETGLVMIYAILLPLVHARGESIHNAHNLREVQ